MRFLLVVAVAVAALVAAGSASAHRATVSLTCDEATFSYTAFPEGQSFASYVVKIDGGTYADGSFSVTGPSDTKTLPLSLTGSHTVYAETSWTADGGGKASASAELQCAPPPSAECPPGTSVFDKGPPLVCLKVETRTNTVTRTETVTVPVEKIVEKIVEVPVEKIVEKPVFVTKWKTKVKRVVKWKTKRVVVVKRVVRWKPCPIPKCKRGTTLVRIGKRYVCAIEGSG